MTYPIAQIAALACHLNAHLRGFATSAFYPGNSTCRFCRSIRFLRKEHGVGGFLGRWRAVATEPAEWFDWIKLQAPQRAALYHEPGNQGQADRWILGVGYLDGVDCWQAEWQHLRPSSDGRDYAVEYRLVDQRAVLPRPKVSVPDASQRLLEALSKIERFARQHELGGFADAFQVAGQCLSNATASVDEHSHQRDLAPSGVLSLPARNLLAAAQAAWVFGGMGSWNDHAFVGDELRAYRDVTEPFYQALVVAICVGVNDSAPR